MWRIENPTIQTARLDFTSSGQTIHEVQQLVGGDIILINALDLIEWDADGTQVIICEQCGITGCGSGGWINLRKSGDMILMIPIFDEIESETVGLTEYGPPRYVRKNGIPHFCLTDYQSLVDRDLGFPPSDTLSDLKMSDAMRLVQSEMPYRVFGEPPLVELTREKGSLLVAASEGEHKQHLDTIEYLLRSHYDNPVPAEIREIDSDDEVISLFLDADEFIDWRALAKTRGEYRLILDGCWVVEPK